ncbi:uncharacterized protein [Mycetomoellerius zeteki]|uniref:uncharacterized protein n=1 Tax=Mycetomoellerius zeteki TaxID=64791 RepID=UPI00084E66D9|nr:PREDICTED: uncharacterized protein LOC108730824 [Trachymyrmex zeteki]
MKNAIIATLDHYCSTNKSPRHDNCPSGADSWCEWRQAEVKNQLRSYKHPAQLIDEGIEKHIRPIYEQLSKDELLNRCLGGHTQNSNESFNPTVWRMAPKHLHSGVKIIEIAANLAAGIFNEGYSAVLITMQMLNINIGQQCKMFADTVDAQRISRANKRETESSKEARTARRLEQMQQDEFYEEEEGNLYGAGIAD